MDQNTLDLNALKRPRTRSMTKRYRGMNNLFLIH